MYSYVKFSELKGKTIFNVEKSVDEIIFTTNAGKYKMIHEQDCCENVQIEDITGDLNSLIGNKIYTAIEATNEGDHDWGTFTYTFYHLTDEKGNDVTIRWYGESNGYYSESVDLIKL